MMNNWFKLKVLFFEAVAPVKQLARWLKGKWFKPRSVHPSQSSLLLRPWARHYTHVVLFQCE